MIISSCKNFKEQEVKDFLESYLEDITHIKMTVHYDTSINNLIKKLKYA
jgi:hypothetical protein